MGVLLDWARDQKGDEKALGVVCLELDLRCRVHRDEWNIH